MVTHDEEWMKIIEEFGTGGETTDEILWGKIKDELDKRSLPPITDSISLSTVNEVADGHSDNHFQVRPLNKSSTAFVTCLLVFAKCFYGEYGFESKSLIFVQFFPPHTGIPNSPEYACSARIEYRSSHHRNPCP